MKLFLTVTGIFTAFVFFSSNTLASDEVAEDAQFDGDTFLVPIYVRLGDTFCEQSKALYALVDVGGLDDTISRVLSRGNGNRSKSNENGPASRYEDRMAVYFRDGEVCHVYNVHNLVRRFPTAQNDYEAILLYLSEHGYKYRIMTDETTIIAWIP